MTHDELAELMASAPGGDNHGRARTAGGWRSLERLHTELDYIVPDPAYNQGRRLEKSPAAIPHGTRTGYRDRCRCAACRRAQRDYMRRYRAGL